VKAAALNFSTRLIIAGKYQLKPPSLLAGIRIRRVVESVGPGDVCPGDRVLGYAATRGAREDRLSAQRVVKIPERSISAPPASR